MYNQQFLKSERQRRRKAMIFTILFHLIIIGGFTFGTDLGSKMKDAVKSWFQEEAEPPVENAALVKNEI